MRHLDECSVLMMLRGDKGERRDSWLRDMEVEGHTYCIRHSPFSLQIS